ncbi:MAG: hypothetical protein PHD03_01980 [Bacilli bacterium]|nr:hypothetical protein [Bacilli bacterium]MDD4734321.1 hypothetical protein [Bacilli bacterium]
MKKRDITKAILFVVVILLAVIGISYAYFTANISNSESATTLTVTGGTMTINYSGGTEINVSNVFPKPEAATTKTFTVTGTNTTAIAMNYKCTLVVTGNTFSSNALKYKMTSTNTDGNGTIIPAITIEQNIATGTNTLLLGNGSFAGPTGGAKIHTYALSIYFPSTVSSQNADQDKSFTAYIKTESVQ